MVMPISRLLVFQWVLITPHWWQMCSYIHMQLIVYNIYKSKSKKHLQEAKTSFNLTFRYKDDVISLKFNDYIDVIYPKELDIKDTTDAPKWDNYLDLHLEFDEDDKLFK